MGTITIKSTHQESQGDYVVIEEKDFDESKGHVRFVPPPPVMVPAPPAAPVVESGIPADWRKKSGPDLQALAASLSGGRMPENKEQAVAMIEAAGGK